MALISTILLKKIPVFALLLLFVFGTAYHFGSRFADTIELARQAGEITKLQKSNSNYAQENQRLSAQNTYLALNNRAQRKEISGLREMLTESERICAKQLSDRELIARIKAGDSCIIKKEMMVVSGETSAQAVYFINNAFGSPSRPH